MEIKKRYVVTLVLPDFVIEGQELPERRTFFRYMWRDLGGLQGFDDTYAKDLGISVIFTEKEVVE